MMNLIGCNERCKYQKDGYCILTSPALVTRSNGCVHFVCQESALIASRTVLTPINSIDDLYESDSPRKL